MHIVIDQQVYSQDSMFEALGYYYFVQQSCCL